MMGVFVQLNEGKGNGMSQRYPIGYVIEESGCWRWVGSITPAGYGGYGGGGSKGRRVSAYRWVYELHKGPVPLGLTLDHLCRNRLCVNPDHLEPVTNRENLMRGNGVTSANYQKTHCHRGHSFTGKNLYLMPTEDRKRRCRTCDRERRREHRRRKNGLL